MRNFEPRKPYAFDLIDIKQRGKLIALTGSNSSSYFVYKGKPMGYEYDMLNTFCKHLGVELEVVVVKNMDHVFDMLNQGIGDIVAANLTITQDRAKIVEFSEPLMETKQVLIQKESKNPIRDLLSLENQSVYVRKGSSYNLRLKNIAEEIGKNIHIVEVSGDYSTEELIEDVVNDKINLTVADENIAKINKLYYPGIDIETAISFPQQIAWATRKSSKDLHCELNNWLKTNKGSLAHNTLYNKYFKSSWAQKKRARSDYASISGEKISIYDDVIKRQSKMLGWDWRLVAAVIYQESKFIPDAESRFGAYGLMQIMPETAGDFDIEDFELPENNIVLGTMYLAQIQKYWEKRIDNREDVIKFTLASYNVGLGHVLDAQRLAAKYHKQADVWDENVAEFLKLKSKPSFYRDEVCRNGYCRGNEPYNYVRQIMTLFEHYKNAVS